MEKTIKLYGRISSDNAAEVESKIRNELNEKVDTIIIDAEDLGYVSSAGLRVLMRLKKEYGSLCVINCNSTIYETFVITGFSEVFSISKKYRDISIDGLEKIGDGFYGSVYRLDKETIVKVYKYPDSLNMIRREQQLARKALVMGISTAIPYDIVHVGDLYGTVFELINPEPATKLVSSDKSLENFCVKSAEILKAIHSIEVSQYDFPSRREQIIEEVIECKGHFNIPVYDSLKSLIATIPESNKLLHCDFHIKNILKQGEELILIDMDTLSRGHPIFEFAAMYATYIAFGCINKNNSMEFLGISSEKSKKIWDLTFRNYFKEKNEKELKEILDKIKVISYIEVLYLRSKYGDFSNETTRNEILYSSKFITDSVNSIKSLNFD